jgi:hypothetical protein
MNIVIGIAAVVSLLVALVTFLRWFFQWANAMGRTKAEQELAAERAAMTSELAKARDKLELEHQARLRAERAQAQTESDLQRMGDRVSSLEGQLQRLHTRPRHV